jgi:hypothetical protein
VILIGLAAHAQAAQILLVSLKAPFGVMAGQTLLLAGVPFFQLVHWRFPALLARCLGPDKAQYDVSEGTAQV